MRKLSAVLTLLILTSLLVPAVMAQGPAQDVVGKDPVPIDETLVNALPPQPDAPAPNAPVPASGLDYTILDDFNRADGPIGPDWEVHDGGYFNIVSNAVQGGGYARATYTPYAGDGMAAEADLAANGTALQFTGLVLNFGYGGNDPFLKVQEQSPYQGQFTHAACYTGGGGSFGLGFFSLSSPFTTAHMKASRVGDTVTIEFTNVDGGGQPDQTYVCTGAPSTIDGNGIGIVGYAGIARLDNFGIPGETQEPDIRVDPESLEATLCPDSQTTVQLNICNDGGAPLFWTLEELPPGGRVLDVLWDNGPLVTHPGGGYGGADLSMLQTNLGLSTFGFGHQYYYGYRITDDFVADAEWTVDQITFFAYQTNAPTDPSTFLSYNLAVWDGMPPGGTIIWGNYVDNCMVDSGWMGAYRAVDYDPLNSARPIMANVCETPGLVLPPGQYWLDWQADGSLSSGPWAPPITLLGETTTGDGMQSLDNGVTWAAAIDTGAGTPQGFPFIIEGGGEPGIPWLSEDPTAGEVNPGECQTVDVTFDSTGLAPDTYVGELLINSNDPDEPETFVPVTLTVEPCENTMHVGGIEGFFSMDYMGRPVLRMFVLAEDGQAMPLEGVAVTSWMWVPDGGPFERTRMTKPSGWARFHWGSTASGTWTICVENMELMGYLYNPDDNVVTCVDWYY